MASAISTSRRSLPIVNDNCVMRRNVRTQPYGRCSVCTLQLKQCHAWQFSGMSFLLIMSSLAVLFVPPGWALKAIVLAIVLQIVLQAVVNHKRTDQLIYGGHELRRARDHLEEQVERRTTELRETNRALARSNLEAFETAQRREGNVVDISHELRTPITSIKGAAQNLLDGVSGSLSEDQREYIAIIRDHAGRLIDAAETIIAAARGAEPTVRLDTRQLDVAQLAGDVVRGLQPVAEERNIELAVDANPVEVEVDEAKLRTVIENLVSNALKFTDQGGRVSVRVQPSETGAEVRVVDNGVGIGEEEREKIFERFYRAGAPQPGTGVGLAIVRDLVHLHGGELTVESRRGGGSAFTVRLPGTTA